MPNVFLGFRIMVGVGLYMIAAAWLALAVVAPAAVRDPLVSASGGADLVGRLRRRHFWLGRQRKRPAALDCRRHFAHCGCGLAGAGGSVAATLILFVLVYGVVFSFGIYFINRLIAQGIQETRLPESTPHLAAGHPTFDT